MAQVRWLTHEVNDEDMDAGLISKQTLAIQKDFKDYKREQDQYENELSVEGIGCLINRGASLQGHAELTYYRQD